MGIIAAAPHLELHALNGASGHAVHLDDLQVGLAQVAQLQGGGFVFLQVDRVDGIVAHPAVLGFYFLHGICPWGQAVQHDHTVCVRKVLGAVAAVDLIHLEQHVGQRFTSLGVDLAEDEAGLLTVGKGHGDILALFGLDPDGFAVVGVQNPGGWDVDFVHLIAARNHVRQGGLTVRAGGDVVFVGHVDAPNMEGGVGDGVARLGVHLFNGQAALVVVGFGDGDGLLPL